LKIRIYKTIILPVVLYGSETWPLTLRKGHTLKMFERKVLRTIFGPKRDEIVEGWRKLHNDELHNLYSTPKINRMIKSRTMRWEGHLARIVKIGNAHNALLGNQDGKRPLRKRCR
jgi:hypothetical protein